MESAKTYSAVAALAVAAILAFLSFHIKEEITANMLILVAQFLMYSLTLFGFGELASKIYKNNPPSSNHGQKKVD